MQDRLSLVISYHKALPDRIRRYLIERRGVRDDLVDFHLLGWNGQRITIPIFDRDRNVAFFKLAKDPEDKTDSRKMLTQAGASPELYGWETVAKKPEQIIICEGEFDRLVLESHGFPAVTSTAGAGVFRPAWAEALKDIPNIYVCFDRDEAGRGGVLHVARLLPGAKVIELPEEVGQGGDVTDFFVRLGKGRAEFLKLMEQAQPVPAKIRGPGEPSLKRPSLGHRSRSDHAVEGLKRLVPIAGVIGQYTALKPSGKALVGLCPFHKDKRPSLAVYPATGRFYCFGCRRHGDLIAFLMEKEGLSFPEALEALRVIARRKDAAA